MPDLMPPAAAPPLGAPAPRPAERLGALLATRQAVVAVIGLGYVGVPLALAFAGAGFPTLGFDRDAERIRVLGAGESPLSTIPAAAIRAAARFTPATSWARLGEADAVLICVPTPVGPNRQPDLSAVEQAARRVAQHLRPGQLVVLESTTWPGTSREVVLPILEATGLRCGQGFFLAYAPEREDPGRQPARIPRIIGGADPVSLRLAQALYAPIASDVVPVASLEVAEAAKLVENVFRAVNIALVNELKQVFGAMGLDAWQVLEAAGTKPFGYMPFWPGPGPGGHCIPVDPHYLAWKAREAGVPTRFVDLAGEINGAMPRHVLDRLAEALDRATGRGLRGARVLVLGVGYKRNLEDVRGSPGLALMALLEGRGALVAYADPLVPVLPQGVDPPGLAGRASVAWEAAAPGDYDAALIVTDHDAVDYRLLVARMPLVVDTRNICARLGITAAHVVKA